MAYVSFRFRRIENWELTASAWFTNSTKADFLSTTKQVMGPYLEHIFMSVSWLNKILELHLILSRGTSTSAESACGMELWTNESRSFCSRRICALISSCSSSKDFDPSFRNRSISLCKITNSGKLNILSIKKRSQYWYQALPVISVHLEHPSA